MQPAHNVREFVSYQLQLDSHNIAKCTIPGRIVDGYTRVTNLLAKHIHWLSGSCHMTTVYYLKAGDRLLIDEESTGFTRPVDFHISKDKQKTYWGIVAI